MLYSRQAVKHLDRFIIHNNVLDQNAYVIGRTDFAVIEFNKAYRVYEERNLYMPLFYDTSFQANKMGYISAILYAHICLRTDRSYGKNNDHHPHAMGLLQTMIHQNKDMANHLDNWAKADQKLNLKDKKICIITDREFKGHDLIPNAKTILCWNHLRQSVKRKAIQWFKMEKEQKHLLMDSLLYLLQADSVATYQQRLEDLYHGQAEPYQHTKQQLARLPENHLTCQQLWLTKKFQDYFDKYVSDDIVQYAGVWYLETLGIEKPHEGITSNRSEVYNHMTAAFKRDQGFVGNIKASWAESIIMMKVFADKMDVDIVIGYYNTLTYNVCPSLPGLRRDPAKLPATSVLQVKDHMTKLHELVKKYRADNDDSTSDANCDTSSDSDDQSLKHPVEVMAQRYLDEKCILNSDLPSCWLVRELDEGIMALPKFLTVRVEIGQESCGCNDKYAKRVPICAHYLAVAVHCKLRGQPRLTEAEWKDLDKPQEPKKHTNRAKYGQKTPTTLNKQNVRNIDPICANMFVDNARRYATRSPRTPRTPRTPTALPSTPTTPRRTPRTPPHAPSTPTNPRGRASATIHASSIAPYPSINPTASTYPPTTSGPYRLRQRGSMHAIRILLQGNKKKITF